MTAPLACGGKAGTQTRVADFLWLRRTISTGGRVFCTIDTLSGWATAMHLPEHFFVFASIDAIISFFGVTSRTDSAFPGKLGKHDRFRLGTASSMHCGG
jgi:hypothetical protein